VFGAGRKLGYLVLETHDARRVDYFHLTAHLSEGVGTPSIHTLSSENERVVVSAAHVLSQLGLQQNGLSRMRDARVVHAELAKGVGTH
jgi:hypothetical protein